VRFIIRSTAAASTIVTSSSCNALADGSIDVTVPAQNWNVTLSANNGYEFMAQGSVTFDHLQAGEYLLQVEHPTCGLSSQLISVDEPAAILTTITGVEKVECNTGNGGMFSFEVCNASWFNYEVRNNQNEVVLSANVEGNNTVVEGLTAGLYTVHVYTPCSNEVLTVDLRDEFANTLLVEQQIAAVNENQFTAQLHATSAQQGTCVWNFTNGSQYIGNEVQLTLQAGEALQYSVMCDGLCDVTATGSVQALSLATDENVAAGGIVFMQSADLVKLQFGRTESRQVEARLYDAQGRMIESTTFVIHEGMQREWPINALSRGAYTLVIAAENQHLFTQKFIK